MSERPMRPEGPGGSEDQEGSGELQELRRRIVEVDEALVALIGERKALVQRVGELKREMGLPVLDPAREAAVLRRAVTLARERGVDEELIRDVVWRIMASARDEQAG